jgi:hypothetical protein
VENTANFNMFMGSQPNVDDLAAIQKMAEEQTKRTQELLKQQKKITDDKIAELKGETEAEKKSRKIREDFEKLKNEDSMREHKDLIDSIQKNNEKYSKEAMLRKIEEENLELKKTAAEKLKKSFVLDVLPEKIQKAGKQDEPKNDKKEQSLFSKLNEGYKQFTDTFKNAKKQQDDGEQKNLGEKENRISFNPEAIKILKTLLIPLYTGLNVGALDAKLKELVEGQKEILKETKGSSLLSTLGKLLLMGGVATLLVGVFWDKIKPWIESKIGNKLDFLDKFVRIGEELSKFFVTGGLRLTFGPAIKIVGGVFKTFGSLIESGLTAAFKAILPIGGAAGEAAGAGAKAATGFKGLLPKIAGGLFKGIGAATLRAIPVIGSLISFYFAYDRISKGDYIGGVIDIVGGIGSLLEGTPLAPLGLAMNFGALALNTFLDYKVGTEKGNQGKKLGAIGGIFTGLWNFLKKVPVFGSIITFTEGIGQFFYSLISGDFDGIKTGLEKMGALPMMFLVTDPLLALLDSTKTDEKGKISGFDTGSIWKNLKLRVGKTILSWFSWLPKSWQKSIADLMGVPFEGGNEDEGNAGGETNSAQKALASKKAELANFNLQYGEKGGNKKKREELENAVKNAETQENSTKSSAQLEDEKYKKLKKNFETQKTKFETYDKQWGNAIPKEHMDKQEAMLKSKKALMDYEKENKQKEKPSVVAEPVPNTFKYEPAPNEPQAPTQDAHVSKMMAIQNNLQQRLMNQLSISAGSKDKADQKGHTIINNNSQAPKSDNKEYLFKPVRDANYEKRMSWWGSSMNYRATV